MRKLIVLFLFIFSVFVLTACDGNIKYNETNVSLDGNTVFYYETKNDDCIALYSTTIELLEEVSYEILYNCNIHYVVLYNDDYIPLIEYVNDYLESIEDLLNSNLGYPIYSDSVEERLAININDFTLDEIVIRTLNGEYKEYGGQWSESVSININLVDISNQIVALFATRVETSDVCDNTMCVIYGNISPGSIYLSNGDAQLRFDFYGNRYQIYYEKEGSTIWIYDIPFTEENELLAETILDAFYESE